MHGQVVALLQPGLEAQLDLPGLGEPQGADLGRTDDDLEKIERYQAEALAYQRLPVEALIGLACHGPAQKAALDAEAGRRGLSLTVAVRPGWYF